MAEVRRVGTLVGSLALVVVAAALGGACGGAGVDPRAAEGATGEEATSCARVRQGGPKRVDAGGGIGSTLALATWEGRTLAFVADEDDRAVLVVDVDSGKQLSATPLDGKPSQLLFLSDGRLVVGLRDRAELSVLEPGTSPAEPLDRRCRVEAAAEPVALALAPDDATLVVSSGWGRALGIYDTGQLKRRARVELGREPRAVAVSDDGRSAIVAHAVGGHASIVDLASRSIRRVSLEGRHDHEIETFRAELQKNIALAQKLGKGAEKREMIAALQKMEKDVAAKKTFANRRTSCQGYALAKTVEPRGRILAPQVLVDPGDPSRRTVGYGEEHVQTELPSIAVIDDSTGYPMPNSLRIGHGIQLSAMNGEQEREHCILPRAAAVDPTTHSLLVSCFGTDMVVAYDALSPDPVMAEKRRWRVAAGPSGIAVDPAKHRAVVWSQFDRTLNVIPLGGRQLEMAEGEDDGRVRRFELPADPERQLSVAEALGRSLFHATGDGRIARDGRACASCHPDGRDDGLVWATPNGARRTKLLAGMLRRTAPYSWDGDAHSLREHVTETFKRLNGVGGLRSVELRALVAYIASLAPPPVAVAREDARIRRGAEIFASKQAGCAGCHEGPLYTDNEVHDVKSKSAVDRKAAFNTPSLRFVANRAPYYHDGRYRTLRELLEGSDGTMGHTKHLSDEDLGALEAFLRTL